LLRSERDTGCSGRKAFVRHLEFLRVLAFTELFTEEGKRKQRDEHVVTRCYRDMVTKYLKFTKDVSFTEAARPFPGLYLCPNVNRLEHSNTRLQEPWISSSDRRVYSTRRRFGSIQSSSSALSCSSPCLDGNLTLSFLETCPAHTNFLYTRLSLACARRQPWR
jgi:hypothetical protein